MPKPPTIFPHYRFAGSHRRIGAAFGESCSPLITRHPTLAFNRLQQRAGIVPEQACRIALAYRPFAMQHAPFLDEEIQGVAAGAGLTLGEAYVLQLRAELAVTTAVGADAEHGDECTTFAALPGATVSATSLIGQNAVLPEFYREIAVMTEIVPDDAPAVMMLTPAGQISYIGINDQGLGIFANYLTCDGWRIGYPRYLLSRLALTQASVEDAIRVIRAVPRASSRNLLMLDGVGVAADLETTPTRVARLRPVDGLLAHTNHYTAPDLLMEARSPDRWVKNSRVRLDRITTLLSRQRGRLDLAAMQAIFRDRATQPDALCRLASDGGAADVMTFASVIAEPLLGRMHVAVGPPNEHQYEEYRFSCSPSKEADEPQSSRSSSSEILAS